MCGKNTHNRYLRFSRKTSYMGHRRFLLPTYPYRKKKSWFDGNEEHGKIPRIMTGRNISLEHKDYVNEFGKEKNGKRKKINDNEELGMWKKRSIFFSLPY